MIIGNQSIKNGLFFVLAIAACAIVFSPDYAGTAPGREAKNVILIGWDGAERDCVKELLSRGELPNLEKLRKEGCLVNTRVTTGETMTKPGWAEILTGYNAPGLGISNNMNYKPIPEGYTIFERLETHFGRNNIITVFIVAKDYNLGGRGPHEICINVATRHPDSHISTFLLDKRKCDARSTIDGKPRNWVFREGEPYFYSIKTIDFHRIGRDTAEEIGEKALYLLVKYNHKPFFMFFHFKDADEQGHRHGLNSAEYKDALKQQDYWLGVIMNKLETLGIYNRTTIFLTSDHGMNKSGFEHNNAPDTFLVTNSKRLLKTGDRKDITPTILEEYEIDLNTISPPLDGRSLFYEER